MHYMLYSIAIKCIMLFSDGNKGIINKSHHNKSKTFLLAVTGIFVWTDGWMDGHTRPTTRFPTGDQY